MMTFALLLILGLAPIQEKEQERPRVPKDSIELVLTGCLKGRVLAVSSVRQTDVETSPDIRARSFRLAGKKDVMKDVKKEDNHLVEVTGIVRRSALYAPGMRVGKGNIIINGGRPVAGSGAPPPSDLVPVMDVESVRLRSTSCSGG